MSYSFTAKASTKADALAEATAKLDSTIAQQPVHERDREAALANVRTHLELLSEPSPDEDVTISMNGSISIQNFNATGSPERVAHAASACSVYVAQRVA